MTAPTDPQLTRQLILQFVQQQSGVELEADTDLIEEGVLDSLLITDLMMHIQDEHGVALSVSDISPRKMRSVETISQLVSKKQSKAA